MMKQFFFTIYLLAFAINGMAAKIDSTAMIEHHSLWNNLLNADNNPVLKSWQYKSNLSCIYATLDYKHANKALITEMGNGHSFYDVAANSYQHLSPTTTIWGGASYRNGTKTTSNFVQQPTTSYSHLMCLPIALEAILTTNGICFTEVFHTHRGISPGAHQ